jgi:hypothetical protein
MQAAPGPNKGAQSASRVHSAHNPNVLQKLALPVVMAHTPGAPAVVVHVADSFWQISWLG